MTLPIAVSLPASADGVQSEDAPSGHRRIRVLHLITSLNRGGAENHLYALATHVDRARFDFEVAALRGEGNLIEAFRAAGVRVHLLGAKSQLDLGALGRLVKLIADERYDVVHSHLFRADLYGWLAVGRVAKRPKLVSTRHNDDRFFLHPLVGIVHYLVSGSQDMIIAISDHIARFTIARGVKDPRRVRRVYHGLRVENADEAERDRSRLRAELGVAPDDFLVGNVGRLSPQKGQRHLIRALPTLLERVPNAQVAIAGAGELEPELMELAAELNVTDRVHLLGSRSDVPALMRAFDAFAMPSIWEGFGIVLLEAMAAGRPIVASAVATIPEVVVDEETGYLTPPAEPEAIAEALTKLALDPELAYRMGQAGQDRLRQSFSLEKMVGDTELLYGELVRQVG
jgi:glycosyltransferase involved in cell wall biosynthesis